MDAPLPPAPPAVATGAAAVAVEKVVREVANATPEEKQAIAIDQKLLMSEVQILLAEKRTAFALLRTGVTVAMVPLSLWTFLVATSRLYNVFDVMGVLLPIMVVAVGLFFLGSYLILHALRQMRHTEQVMLGLRKSDTLLEDLLYKELGARYLPSFKALRLFRRRVRGAS